MSPVLGVDPALMTTTGAGVIAGQGSAGAATAGLATPLLPVPAGADDVSLLAATQFSTHAADLLLKVATGFVNGAASGSTLAEVAAAFTAQDGEGAARISTVSKKV
ncbi:MAG: PE domain-containing protein [Mycobacteriaceae bacterium]|nr:PE domain-containing protein [Mycobacteriaceae bacterium]